jgi:putative ABC transport system substrate-binding protein
MNRREFITFLSSAAAGPFTVRAQQAKPVIIGFLGADKLADYGSEVASFRQGIKQEGFIDGQNVTIEFRWAEGQYDRLSALAVELLSSSTDVIVCSGAGPMSVRAAKTVAGVMPIVFATALDPVASGIVPNLQPQSNITGVSYDTGALSGARLELLHELLPKASTIAALKNPESPYAEIVLANLRSAADKLRLKLDLLSASNRDEINRAFATFDQQRPDALVVLTDLLFTNQRHQIVELAARYRMPAIYDQEFFVRVGGLMSYGASPSAAYREAGVYVGQILNGAVPADLPILLPSRYELLLNLNAAKSIGLNIPDSFLYRPDEVIK